MKLGKLASDEFAASLKALMDLTNIPGKTAFAIRGVAKIIEVECTKCQELKMQYLKDAAEKNENGEMIHEGTRIKLVPSKLDELSKKMADLNDIEVVLPEIKYDDLSTASVGLTPKHLFNLEFIVE